MDVTQLVRQATPTNLPPLARGRVWGGENHPQGAPTAFTEAVWVILPEGSSEHLYGPCKWLAGHGIAKPQPGAACVVGFDEQNQPVIVWWDGAQTEPTFTPAEHSITEAMLEATVQAKLNPGAWTALALGTKLETFAGFQTPAVRTEQGATSARLRGVAKVKAGQEVKAGETFITLAEGFRPPGTAVITATSGGAFNSLQIAASGTLVLEKPVTAGQGIPLDAITYGLT